MSAKDIETNLNAPKETSALKAVPKAPVTRAERKKALSTSSTAEVPVPAVLPSTTPLTEPLVVEETKETVSGVHSQRSGEGTGFATHSPDADENQIEGTPNPESDEKVTGNQVESVIKTINLSAIKSTVEPPQLHYEAYPRYILSNATLPYEGFDNEEVRAMRPGGILNEAHKVMADVTAEEFCAHFTNEYVLMDHFKGLLTSEDPNDDLWSGREWDDELNANIKECKDKIRRDFVRYHRKAASAYADRVAREIQEKEDREEAERIAEEEQRAVDRERAATKAKMLARSVLPIGDTDSEPSTPNRKLPSTTARTSQGTTQYPARSASSCSSKTHFDRAVSGTAGSVDTPIGRPVRSSSGQE